jgi:hypothetical protein
MTDISVSKVVEMDLQFLEDVAAELRLARAKHAPMNSHHEAYAVILEELDEYWDEVRKQRSKRDPHAMYLELVQIAAMAARAATDLAVPAGPAEEASSSAVPTGTGRDFDPVQMADDFAVAEANRDAAAASEEEASDA